MTASPSEKVLVLFAVFFLIVFALMLSGCSVRDYGLYPPIIFPNAGH